MNAAVLIAVAMAGSLCNRGAAAQSARAQQAADSTAPYLRRGKEIERRYQAYREDLERFFNSFAPRVDREAPDLRARLLPPAAVPYGYQILPTLLAEAAWQPKPARIVLSPFSWPRTATLIDRDSSRLVRLRARLNDSKHQLPGVRRADVEFGVSEYLALVQGQKLMASQIQYNRLWQGEVARTPAFFQRAKDLQSAAIERQALEDSLSTSSRQSSVRRARVDSLRHGIDDALRKMPTPGFVAIVHPALHRWILRVPVYTDIEDSAFVERFRGAIERAWHVRAGDDDYSVAIEIRRLTPARLYAPSNPPARGAHIDVASHIVRFPLDGAVLTTGANTIYSIGRSIIVGPHAVGPSALVHEFGHVLGFRDGYFRSYEDRGADGFEVVEVILDPESVVAAPEHGRVRREHFIQILGETRR